MNDVATLLEIVLSLAAMAGVVLVIVFGIAGASRARLADLFALPSALPWPRGVQEEDCPRWDLARLERPGRRPDARSAEDGHAVSASCHGHRVARWAARATTQQPRALGNRCE